MARKNNLALQVIIPTLIVLLSVLFAVIFADYFLGFLTLLLGALNAYYSAIGKWCNYIFGILGTISYSAICWINGLYGYVIVTVFAYIPLQIYGLVSWRKKQSQNEVLIKSLSLTKGILLTVSVCAISFLFGFLLNLIPSQNLAYLDSTSQIVGFVACTLGTLRFRENWYIYLVNNTLDLSIWTINFVNHTDNAGMMFVTSIMYFVMNIYGLIKWILIEQKQKKYLAQRDIADEETFAQIMKILNSK